MMVEIVVITNKDGTLDAKKTMAIAHARRNARMANMVQVLIGVMKMFVAKGSCDATGCTFGGVPMACGEGCKRGCSKCDQNDCQDLGTIMGNYGDDFCAQIVKNGLCNKNNDA